MTVYADRFSEAPPVRNEGIRTIMKAPTILLVDDEVSGLDALQKIFAGDEFDVETASSGREALKKAEELRPDLVLLDVHMPGMSGLDVCRAIRGNAELAEAGIILVTGVDDRGSRLAGLEAGADDFVGKPFDATELRLRVRNQLKLLRFRHLTEERNRFDRFFNEVPEPAMIIDDEGVIRLANPRATSLLSEREDSVVGTNLFQLMDRNSRVHWLQMLPHVIREGESRTGEPLTLHSPGRGPMDFEAHLGSTVLNEQPMAHLTLRSRRETSDAGRLIRAARVTPVVRLTRAAIHDFNNLWQTVRVNAELLAMDAEEASEAHADLTEIVKLADRGADLGKVLVTFARADPEGVDTVSISETLRRSWNAFELLTGRNVHLSLEEGTAVPAVQIEPTDLQQIVPHLLLNSLDAIGDHEGRIRITTVGRNVEGKAMAGFALTDNGGGVDEEDLDQLFEPGFTTRNRPGLGLAAVRALVFSYDGRVTARNVEGGLEVELLFPAA